jgi:hypothetical protein
MVEARGDTAAERDGGDGSHLHVDACLRAAAPGGRG